MSEREGERQRVTPARNGAAASSSGPAGFWSQVTSIAWAVVIALMVRAMVLETYYVPSESMLPTLLIGDHMLVNKFAYGARVPFTGWRLPGTRDPRRGDVVVFELGRKGPSEICPLDRCPEHPREGFVKRIVGLPGDTIEVREGRVILNGAPVSRQGDGETFVDEAGESLHAFTEDLGEARYGVLDHPKRRGLEQVRITVPEGRYFMMGDNRDNSNDSRAWGTVSFSELKGPVMRIYWSWNNQGSWLSMLSPLTWWRLLSGETRWDRIGRRVD
jgi:signal peptidase I